MGVATVARSTTLLVFYGARHTKQQNMKARRFFVSLTKSLYNSRSNGASKTGTCVQAPGGIPDKDLHPQTLRVFFPLHAHVSIVWVIFNSLRFLKFIWSFGHLVIFFFVFPARNSFMRCEN